MVLQLKHSTQCTECRFQKEWDAGMVLLNHSMHCAMAQWKHDGKFVLEHPMGALSWKEDCVQQAMELEGVRSVSFGKCCFCAKTKADGTPVRKRTRFLTNSTHAVAMIGKKICRHPHEHKFLGGAEGG